MNVSDRLKQLNPAQRQLLIEQLKSRKVLQRKMARPKLVAVLSGCCATQEQELSDYIAGSLPSYMLPSHWYFLAELPRNRNGKLDRAALARQLREDWNTGKNSSADKVSPEQKNIIEAEPERSEIEQTLATIWAEVLFMDEVQRDDDYFELGGDSIASMQIVARASKHDLEFSTQDIMRFPSVGQLAKRLVALQNQQRKAQELNSEADDESLADVMRVLNLGDQ